LPADSGIQGILLTALVGFVFAYLSQLWKYSKDAFHARVDEACGLIFELADSAAEYWAAAKRVSQQIRRPTDPADQHDKLILSEIKIEGQFMKLQFLRLVLQQRFSLSDQTALIERTASFQDAVTGGSFAENIRASDTQRAREVYVTAADLVAHVRQAANRGNRLWRILLRQMETALPYRWPRTSIGQFEAALWLAVSLGCFAVGCGCIVMWYLE
jgi:hypothetical protein